MKKFFNNVSPAALLVLAILSLLPGRVMAQGLVTDQFNPDAASAALGFSSSVRLQGAWAGINNPANWSGQPFIYSGLGTSDLWNHSRNGARLESGAAGMGLGGVVGFGASRQRLRFGDPQEAPFTLPELSAAVTEYTDCFGAGLDIARLLAPGNDFLRLALGLNVKNQARSYYTKCSEPVLVTEEFTNYDLGALARLRIPLAGNPAVDEPASFLELIGSYVVNNASRDRFEEETQGTVSEAGYARTSGLGFNLVLGQISRSRHLLRINGSYESWNFEQEFQPSAKSAMEFTLSANSRYGLEVGLADVLFGRVGRIRLDDQGIEETTFGAGINLMVPALGFRLSADYARAPWLHGNQVELGMEEDLALMDRFSAQVAFGI